MTARAQPTRPPDRRRVLGALLLAAAVAVVALAYAKPNPFADHHTVRVRFADAAGLAPIRADVRLAGTPVGKVTGRERVGDEAELTLELDDDVPPLHADAGAALRPRLFFEGTAYVELTPGTPAAGPLRDGRIATTRTRTYVSLSDAFSLLNAHRGRALARTADGLELTLRPRPIRRAVQGTLRVAPGLTQDLASVARAARGRELVPAPGNARAAARAGGDRSGAPGATSGDGSRPGGAASATGSDRAAATRGSGGTELTAAITQLHRAAGAVAERRDDLTPLPGDLAATAAAAGDPALDAALARLPATTARLRTGSAALQETLARARPLATDLRPAARALTPALAETRPLLRQAAAALRAVTPALRDARAGLDAARPAAPAARRVLGALDGPLRTLDASFLPAIAKPTALGTPAYLAFLGLFAGGGGASRPVQGDQGHFMRFGLRFLSGIGQPLPPCSLLSQVQPALATTLEQAGTCAAS